MFLGGWKAEGSDDPVETQHRQDAEQEQQQVTMATRPHSMMENNDVVAVIISADYTLLSPFLSSLYL